MSVESAGFNYLLEKTGASKGNVSVQISKLKDAQYIRVKKTFKDNKPLTTCSVTPQGNEAFVQYVNKISEYLNL